MVDGYTNWKLVYCNKKIFISFQSASFIYIEYEIWILIEIYEYSFSNLNN